jgi:predicted branched-subunit amino acid permease
VIDEGGGSDARRSFISGLRAGIWVAVAGMLVGVSFGVLAEPLMGEVAPIVMSAAMFAGSAQFAATAVLSAGGGAVAAIVAGVLLNARYAPMGIALAPSLRGGPLRRAAIGQTMIDFAWAAANRGGGRFDPAFMVGVSAPCYVLWVVGTALGVFAAGDLIGDPGALGLDAIFPAFFLCLLVEGELRPGSPALVAGMGSIVALALIPLTPAGVPIIAASACALVGLRWPPR